MNEKLFIRVGLVSIFSCFFMACVSSNVSTVKSDYMRKSLESEWFKTSDSSGQGPSGVKLFNLAKSLNPEVKTKLDSLGKQPDFVKVCELGKRTYKYEFYMVFVEKNEVWRVDTETAEIEIASLNAKLAEQSTHYCPAELIEEYNRISIEKRKITEENRIKAEQDLLAKREKEEREKKEQLRIARDHEEKRLKKEEEEKQLRLAKEKRDNRAKLESDANTGDRVAQYNYAETLVSEGTTNSTVICQMYQKSAEQGYAEAQIKLGQCYLYGNFGVSYDLRKGIDILKKASEGGNVKALNELGLAYLSVVDGCFLDSANAVKCFNAAYEKDNADAIYNLGYCYGMGVGVERSEKEAVEWFRRSAERNNSKALYILGRIQNDEDCLEKSRSSEATFELALDAYALLKRNKQLLNQFGVATPIASIDAVRSQFESAARDGDMIANRKCAQLIHKVRSYELGDAIKYYTVAAEKGDVISKANLHGCLLIKCIAEELAKGKKSGDEFSGMSDAKKYQINMSLIGVGHMPDRCDGGDPESVLKWVDRSMVETARFMYLLGRYKLEGACIRRILCDERDKDVRENRDVSVSEEGLKLVRKAAEAGEPDAMCYLARCYQTGAQVPQNIHDAVRWYQLAVDSGSELAKRELPNVERLKRVYDKKVPFCDKTPEEKTEYLNWRATQMAQKTLVAKNIYLGMPMDEALFSLSSCLNLKCSTNDIVRFSKNTDNNVRTGWYYFDKRSKLALFADENNCLRCFVLPPAVVKKLFNFTSPTVQTVSVDFSRLFDINMEENEQGTPVIDLKNKDVMSFAGSRSKNFSCCVNDLYVTIFNEFSYRNGEGESKDSITARLLRNEFPDKVCIPSGSIIFRDNSSEEGTL